MLKSLVVKMLAGVGICMLMLVIFLGPGAFNAYACSECDDSDCKGKPAPIPGSDKSEVGHRINSRLSESCFC